MRIGTDWSASPPVELWRRPIGPGWSSFAVRGDLLYTQVQRGDDEVVACYKATTGKRKWKGGRYRSGQLARFPGVEGKTWNHPVLVGDLLLVRNAQEMVAFRLSLAGG